MGGIFGKLNFDRAASIPPAVATRMSDALTTRGPHTAIWLDRGIAIGERRGIAGPDPGQVSHTSGSRIYVAADASLENRDALARELRDRGHQLGGRRDGELIARAYDEWGEGCVEHLEGPFAFALWDDTRGRLLLARDHIGIRPLYFAILHGEAVVFASEAQAILQDQSVSREWRPEAIDAYLTLGYIPSPHTMFKAISKLEPAHVLVAAGHALRMRRYWDFPFPASGQAHDDDSAVQRVRTTLEAAVGAAAQHGARILHSGGTASTALMAAGAKACPGVAATAVGVDCEMAELVRIAESARHLGGRPDVELVALDAEDAAPRVAQCLDEPCADPSVLSQHAIFTAVRARTDAVIAGHGAASLWAGYPRHHVDRFEAMMRGWLGPSLAALGGQMVATLQDHVGGVEALSHLALSPAGACAVKHASGLFDDSARHVLYTRAFAWEVRDTNPFARHLELYAQCPSTDPLERAIYVDARTFLPDCSLTVADRLSAAASIQVSYPFLHADAVKTACATPPGMKQKGRIGMYAIQQLFEPLLPEGLMPPPVQQSAMCRPWLSEAVSAMVPHYLLSARFDGRGIFSRPALGQLWEEHRRGRRDHTQRLWALVMLELWFRETLEGGASTMPLEYAVLKAA